MKRFTRTIRIAAIVILAGIIMASLAAPAAAQDVCYYDSPEITEDLLSSRTPDTLIVEQIVGIVLNEAGDGVALNAADPDYNYISYSGLGFKPLDIVMTLVTYNPDTQYIDDIIIRQDARLGTLNEMRFGNYVYTIR